MLAKQKPPWVACVCKHPLERRIKALTLTHSHTHDDRSKHNLTHRELQWKHTNIPRLSHTHIHKQPSHAKEKTHTGRNREREREIYIYIYIEREIKRERERETSTQKLQWGKIYMKSSPAAQTETATKKSIPQIWKTVVPQYCNQTYHHHHHRHHHHHHTKVWRKVFFPSLCPRKRSNCAETPSAASFLAPPLAEMCRGFGGFLLYRFWRVLPGIFAEDVLGTFSHKNEEKNLATKKKKTSGSEIKIREKSALPRTRPNSFVRMTSQATRTSGDHLRHSFPSALSVNRQRRTRQNFAKFCHHN